MVQDDNVKDRFSAIHLRDESRQPWTANCTSSTRLEEACQIISTCTWQGGGGRKLELTKQTAEAFTVFTRNNVDAAKLLLADKYFVLPAIFADEALEKFFGQARQRRGGNFYIDVVAIMAAAKIVNLQTLIKHDIMPESSSRVLIATRIVQLPNIQLSEVNSLTRSLLKTLKNS